MDTNDSFPTQYPIQILQLIHDQKLTPEEWGELGKTGHLPALCRATKEKHLPPLEDFRKSLLPPPKLEVWYEITFGGREDEVQWLKESVVRAGCSIDREIPGEALSFNGSHYVPQRPMRLVRITPEELHLDEWVLKTLPNRERREYIMRRGKMLGLSSLPKVAALFLYAQVPAPFKVTLAQELYSASDIWVRKEVSAEVVKGSSQAWGHISTFPGGFRDHYVFERRD